MTRIGKTAALPRLRTARAADLLAGIATLIRTWRARSRARRDLAKLDEHMLRDIGLDATIAAHEVSRRFWQD